MASMAYNGRAFMHCSTRQNNKTESFGTPKIIRLFCLVEQWGCAHEINIAIVVIKVNNIFHFYRFTKNQAALYINALLSVASAT